MPRLRVALLTFYPLHPEEPDSIPGGVWAVGHTLARLLSTFDDLDLHVVHCQPDLPEDRIVVGEGVTVHYLAVRRRRWRPAILGGVGRMTAYLRALRPDVANAHAAQHAYAAIQAGVPTIYTVHGLVRQEFRTFRGWKQRLMFLLPIYYDTVAARSSERIVAISPYVVRQYQHRTHAPFQRIEVPIAPAFFEVGAERPGQVLFTAGNLNERKDYLTMLRALAEVRNAFPNVQLRIAGTGEPAYRQRLEDFIRKEGLQANVQFLGVLSREGMVRAYAESSLVLLSSRQETAPGIICEGMAAGRPVVATDVGGVADMVEDGVTGFVVPPGDFQALAEGVVRLLRDEGLRREMGAAARERALNRWWPPRVAEQYRQLYREVAARRANGLAIPTREAGGWGG